MAWVHCHIARRAGAALPSGLPEVTKRSRRFIMKLLAKTDEDRYQTAAGPRSATSGAAWRNGTRAPDRSLHARCTRRGQAGAPAQLYGRARQDRHACSRPSTARDERDAELVLVSGAAGIGKSAVVNELHKALVPSRGLSLPPASLPVQARTYRMRARAGVSEPIGTWGQREAALDRWRAALRRR